MFLEGNILQTDFEGKKYLANKYLGKKIYCTEKTPVYVGEKSSEVWGKKSLTQTKSPIVAPQKSNGRLLMRFPQEW